MDAIGIPISTHSTRKNNASHLSNFASYAHPRLIPPTQAGGHCPSWKGHAHWPRTTHRLLANLHSRLSTQR